MQPTSKAKTNDGYSKGFAYFLCRASLMHFHFEQLLVNKPFPTQFDEKTFTPNYKMTAVGKRTHSSKNSHI